MHRCDGARRLRGLLAGLVLWLGAVPGAWAGEWENARDGMMQGVNIEATVKLAQSIRIPVIASGGITSMDDIKALNEVADEGIIGAITGRAIYEGTIDLTEAQRWLAEHTSEYGGVY